MAKVLATMLPAVGAMALLALSGPAQAADLRFRIPFGFTVSGKALPAGTYQVSALDNVLKVRGSADTAFVLAELAHSTTDRRGRLVFYRYGDEFVLGEVWMGRGPVRELPRPRAEPDGETPAQRIEVPVR
jgi:hypothetical protein